MEDEEAAEDEEGSMSLRAGEAPAGDLSDPRPHTEFLEELQSFFAARGATLQVTTRLAWVGHGPEPHARLACMGRMLLYFF